MKKFRSLYGPLLVIIALLCGAPLRAATPASLPLVGTSWDGKQGGVGAVPVDGSGNLFGTLDNPFYTVGGSSTVACGGVVCAKDSSLSTINTTLGSPMQQTGGSVSISGAIPAGSNGIGNVGGFSFQIANALTVQNAAYAAGNSLGGLITVTGAARTNGGTGTLTNMRIRSAGGSTNTIWVYAWSKTPASTCTDKSAFVGSNSDAPYALPGFPQSVTLAAAGSWDTASYGQILAQTVQFKNQDASPGTAIYMCFVTAGAVTPATTTDLTSVETGVQD